jgi:hypothetical protein
LASRELEPDCRRQNVHCNTDAVAGATSGSLSGEGHSNPEAASDKNSAAEAILRFLDQALRIGTIKRSARFRLDRDFAQESGTERNH